MLAHRDNLIEVFLCFISIFRYSISVYKKTFLPGKSCLTKDYMEIGLFRPPDSEVNNNLIVKSSTSIKMFLVYRISVYIQK